MSNAIMPVSKLVEEAKSKIDLIYPFKAKKISNDKNAIFIDVRDIREIWREGKIENAYHAPRGMLEFWIDPSSPYYKKIFIKKESFILYCASGWRSALAARTLKEMGMLNVMSLEGGFNNWKKCALPFVKIKQEKLT